MNGDGVESWADGSSYNGAFKNGMKEGFGVYTWGDGSIYSGEWK